MKPQGVLIGVIALGTAGITISILNLAGSSQPEVQVGIMISGSIVFGSGVIATVLANKK